MSVIGWVILGGIAGWIASMITGRNDRMGCITNIAAGIVGAIVGGWLFSFFGGASVTGFNLVSLLVAVVGAVVVLAIINLIFGRK
ncbi:MAG TPA: GlsB/YeaQ/YmgE family stress response membrane protein [Anaerolineales bacterium]|nr:GlsB/YeaQ/YmgE family stress response membrane protein [Anaerolineales bacterium]